VRHSLKPIAEIGGASSYQRPRQPSGVAFRSTPSTVVTLRAVHKPFALMRLSLSQARSDLGVLRFNPERELRRPSNPTLPSGLSLTTNICDECRRARYGHYRAFCIQRSGKLLAHMARRQSAVVSSLSGTMGVWRRRAQPTTTAHRDALERCCDELLPPLQHSGTGCSRRASDVSLPAKPATTRFPTKPLVAGKRIERQLEQRFRFAQAKCFRKITVVETVH